MALKPGVKYDPSRISRSSTMSPGKKGLVYIMAEKKFRFNIVDVLILLILIAAAGVLAYVFILSDSDLEVKENHNIEYVVEVTSVNEIFRNTVNEGDRVTLASNRKKELGNVSAQPETVQALKTSFDETRGIEVYSPAEGLIDMTITFKGTAEKTEWGYSLDGTYINVNDTFDLIVGDTKLSVTCVRMTVLD